jgi:uncharacterized membrane protein
VNPLIPIHIAGGSIALMSGAAALSARKGGPLHARAGTLFFGAMLAMTGTGAVLAVLKPERGTATIGVLTAYLVATSWATARRRDGIAGGFERAAMLVALGCAAAFATFLVQSAASPTGRVDLLPAGVHVPFGLLALLAAGLDWRFIRGGPLSGRQRIARHLWRMCAALLIAAFSFFLGQQRSMPEFMRGSPFLALPPLAVLAAMIFWIARVRFARAWGRSAPAGAGGDRGPARAPVPAGGGPPLQKLRR